MDLFCIRHGESTYNAQGRIQGQTDIGLSPRGTRQAIALAERMRNEGLEAIYTSPLLRARQTAAPLSEMLGLEPRVDERLQEIHAGMFQGLAWSEIRALHPELADRWLRQEPDFVVPGGESRRSLMVRGQAALEAIRNSGFDRVAIVSHGGLLSAALKALLEIPAQRAPFILDNASITRLEWRDQVRLRTLNDTAHLTQLVGPRHAESDVAL